jgi:hypothetical protein
VLADGSRLRPVGLGDESARWPSWASGTQGRLKARVGWLAFGLPGIRVEGGE